MLPEVFKLYGKIVYDELLSHFSNCKKWGIFLKVKHPSKQLHLYHINDLHSHFENWPKIRRYLNQKKQEHEENNEDVLIFDIGDFLDRVHPLTEATNGKANVQLMNRVAFDAVTIGNNEGIGNTKTVLNQLFQEAKFPVVLGNLFDIEDKNLPDWAQPYIILVLENGIRVGVTGLTAPLYLSYLPNGWQPKESYEVLPELLQEMKPKTDIIILLSHMGIIEDEHMAEMYQDLDVIMGAHTHHVLPQGRLIDGTMLTGGGKWGEYIGHTIVCYSEEKVITSIKTELITCADLPELRLDEIEINRLWDKGIEMLREEEIADIPFTLETEWYNHTDLVDLGLEAITEFANIDIGILNSGLFLDDLPAGIISKETMHHILPHPMRLISCKMSGQNFCDLIFGMEKMREELRVRQVTGMGFRGKIFGEICYKGIKVDTDNKIIYYNGTIIQKGDTIKFVTVDHYRYVSFFPLIENKGESELLFPYFLRDVVSKYLEDHFPILYSK